MRLLVDHLVFKRAKARRDREIPAKTPGRALVDTVIYDQVGRAVTDDGWSIPDPAQGPVVTVRTAETWGLGLKHRTLAIAVTTSLLAGCGIFQGPAPASSSKSVSTGADAGTLELRPGFTVAWGQGTFTSPGRIRSSEITSPGRPPDWFTPDGSPLDISVDGTHGTLDLRWHPQHQPPADGLVPVVLHWYADDKTWTVAASGPPGDVATGISATFSPHWPGWADVTKITDGVTNLVQATLGKRTDPPGCSGGPSWASLSPPAVDVVLTCLTTNHGADGVERAEIQLRNNRGYVLEVPVPPGAAYASVEGQPEVIRAATRVFTGRDSALLSPGQIMTIGFTRPAVGAPVRIDAAPTIVALAAQLTVDIIGETNALAAVVKALSDCKLAPNIAFTLEPDVHSVGDLLRGVVSCFASLFAEPSKARLLALEVVSDLAHIDMVTGAADRNLATKVDALTGKIRLLAVAIKVIDVGSDLIDYVADNWTNHRTGDYTGMSSQLSLLAVPPQPTLGVRHDLFQAGYGEVRPSTVYGAGVPYLVEVHDLRWRSWGNAQAIADGIAAYGTANPYPPYPMEPTVFVAFDLGECRGHLAYRAMEWYFPQHGGQFDPNTYEDICAGGRVINGKRY